MIQSRTAGRSAALACVILLLGACHAAPQQMPGDSKDHQPWHGIAADETVRFAGTEPFWSGEANGERLIYRTPENQQGETVPVLRFAGRGGLSFSGMLKAGAMTLAVSPGDCSDGMSDRRYPFAATMVIALPTGSETRQGCAWTDRQPFSGPANP